MGHSIRKMAAARWLFRAMPCRWYRSRQDCQQQRQPGTKHPPSYLGGGPLGVFGRGRTLLPEWIFEQLIDTRKNSRLPPPDIPLLLLTYKEKEPPSRLSIRSRAVIRWRPLRAPPLDVATRIALGKDYWLSHAVHTMK